MIIWKRSLVDQFNNASNVFYLVVRDVLLDLSSLSK